jgi:hypothetical protein
MDSVEIKKPSIWKSKIFPTIMTVAVAGAVIGDFVGISKCSNARSDPPFTPTYLEGIVEKESPSEVTSDEPYSLIVQTSQGIYRISCLVPYSRQGHLSADENISLASSIQEGSRIRFPLNYWYGGSPREYFSVGKSGYLDSKLIEVLQQ